MSLLELLKFDPTSATQASQLNDESNSEGKFGIPRFNGEPSGLQEYGFCIRARVFREKQMDSAEVKKLGPLGLRMAEGLRGQALRLSQTMDMQELAQEDGPEKLLLALFEKSLKPRKAQEARELYAVGCKGWWNDEPANSRTYRCPPTSCAAKHGGRCCSAWTKMCRLVKAS